jgi:thiamine-monophosphate kinase
MDEIAENRLIDSVARQFRRSPAQVNRLHQSDSEIVELPGFPGQRLAVTVDTVSEEITAGLYRRPETMGWIAVMASLSDLAAVGADPLGLVMGVTLAPGSDEAFRSGIAAGMELACLTAGCHILGGDTNAGPAVALTGCAVGLVPKDQTMLRTGCRPGDAVFVTGGVGIGNALALVRLAGLPDALLPELEYRPVARIREGKAIRRAASCCMDTSDGLLATLDQLSRLNNAGFRIECDWDRLLEPRALDLCRKTATPPWTMTAGAHGEFELVFCVQAARVEAFRAETQAAGVNSLQIGTVLSSPGLILVLPGGKAVKVDFAPVRNLLNTVGGDLKRYVEEFRAFGQRAGLE